MSLQSYLEVATLPKEKQDLIRYVKARIGFDAADQLGQVLLGKGAYHEKIEGEKNSIETWGREIFGIDLQL